MPKIVDTKGRIESICELAYREFLEVGVSNFSLNAFISSLGMSKGQFYHYFKTKEELIFETIRLMSYTLIEQGKNNIAAKRSLKDKLFEFFAHLIDEADPAYKMCNKIINEVLHMYLNSKDPKIRAFNEEIYSVMFEILEQIFKDEVQKDGLNIDYKKYSKISMAVADGMYMQSLMLSNFDFKKELTEYINDVVTMFGKAKK